VLNLRTKKRDAYRVLVGKTEGLRALEISRHNQEDNIRMDLKSHEMECWGLDVCG
jgi:CheY-like chemotaxis protein